MVEVGWCRGCGRRFLIRPDGYCYGCRSWEEYMEEWMKAEEVEEAEEVKERGRGKTGRSPGRGGH